VVVVFVLLAACWRHGFAPETSENVSSGAICGGLVCGVGGIVAPRFRTRNLRKRKLRIDLWWLCLWCWRHSGVVVVGVVVAVVVAVVVGVGVVVVVVVVVGVGVVVVLLLLLLLCHRRLYRAERVTTHPRTHSLTHTLYYY